MYSTSWKVCRVASAAKDTLRLARDLRRASRLSLISFSICAFSFSSLSRAAACCSSSVRRAILVPDALGSSVWKGLARFSVP